MQKKGVEGMALCKALAKEAAVNPTMKSEIAQMRAAWEAKCKQKAEESRSSWKALADRRGQMSVEEGDEVDKRALALS